MVIVNLFVESLLHQLIDHYIESITKKKNIRPSTFIEAETDYTLYTF